MRHLLWGILVFLATAAIAQSGGTPTSAEQREAVVRLAAAYPANPQDAALDGDATAAAKLLENAPDIPVATCSGHLPWIEKKKYKYSHELSVAYFLGSGAYAIQHAEAKPSRLYYPALLAGSQAALHAYQVLLQRDPKANLDKMSNWNDQMQTGKFIGLLEKECSAPNPALSRAKGPITPEEKQRIIALAEDLQKNPLDPALRPDFSELFVVVVQATDFTVQISSSSEPWMDDKPEYKYSPDLLALNVMAMASYVLQNPESGKSAVEHGRAGLIASLRGYEAILKQDPVAHSKSMDAALAAEKEGKLEDWYKTRYSKSSKN